MKAIIYLYNSEDAKEQSYESLKFEFELQPKSVEVIFCSLWYEIPLGEYIAYQESVVFYDYCKVKLDGKEDLVYSGAILQGSDLQGIIIKNTLECFKLKE